jgi:hypothetical protein
MGPIVGLEASERRRIIYRTANLARFLGDPSRSLAALTAMIPRLRHSCSVACIS